MTTSTARIQDRRDWMSIHEACALIGVSPATLRRWSDAGAIKAFTTPGGHRRFSRAAVAGLLPAAQRGRPNLERLGETPERMARVYRRHLLLAGDRASWIREIEDEDRTALRSHGRTIATALLGFFDGPSLDDRVAALASAEEAAAECGRVAGRRGATVAETVDAFIHFRSPFIGELAAVARRRGLDSSGTTQLLETATEGFDRLLSAAMRGHEVGVRARSDEGTDVATGPEQAPASKTALEGTTR